MKVRDIMTRNVTVVRPDSTLQEAADRMKELNVGPMPVCDGSRLVGMLTDRDIAVRGVAEGHDPWTDKVRDVMTPEVVYCFEDQEVEEAAHVMKEKQVRRLLVLDHGKNLVGIVSLGDLAVSTGDDRLSGDVVERVSEPAAPKR